METISDTNLLGLQEEQRKRMVQVLRLRFRKGIETKDLKIIPHFMSEAYCCFQLEKQKNIKIKLTFKITLDDVIRINQLNSLEVKRNITRKKFKIKHGTLLIDSDERLKQYSLMGKKQALIPKKRVGPRMKPKLHKGKERVPKKTTPKKNNKKFLIEENKNLEIVSDDSLVENTNEVENFPLRPNRSDEHFYEPKLTKSQGINLIAQSIPNYNPLHGYGMEYLAELFEKSTNIKVFKD